MKHIKIAAALMLGGLVSACGSANIASRNAPFEADALPRVSTPVNVTAQEIPNDVLAPILDNVSIKKINVTVPETLKVSESNRYLPNSDIVWRGDAIGNRHAQVKAIFETAMTRGTQAMNGVVPVALDIEVTRFHALTEKARYTVGGVHSITFNMTLRNAETGDALGQTRRVRADLDAFGGVQALRAEAAGQTQKVRITAHLAEVIRQELTRAEGFENPKLGLIQVMNGG